MIHSVDHVKEALAHLRRAVEVGDWFFINDQTQVLRAIAILEPLLTQPEEDAR